MKLPRQFVVAIFHSERQEDLRWLKRVVLKDPKPVLGKDGRVLGHITRAFIRRHTLKVVIDMTEAVAEELKMFDPPRCSIGLVKPDRTGGDPHGGCQ